MKYIVLLTCLILIGFSCKDDDSFTGEIAPELRPFIESFIEEGEKRGVFLDIANMEAVFVEELTLPSVNTCGYGFWDYDKIGKGRIEILKNEDCWNSRSFIEKENFVFHELGHAYLYSRHREKTFPNRYPASIMCTSRELETCSNYNTYYDNPYLRNYYLDELFDEGTDSPDFLERPNFVRTIFKEGSEDYLTEWEFYIYQNGEEISVDNNSHGYVFHQDTSANGEPTTITISQTGTTEEDVYCFIVKRFELNDFTECSNIKAFADINTNNMEGEFTVGLSLRERLNDGSLNRFFVDLIRETENNSYEDYLHEVYCIGAQTDVVSISFNFDSRVNSSITIDNIRVDLYEE